VIRVEKTGIAEGTEESTLSATQSSYLSFPPEVLWVF